MIDYLLVGVCCLMIGELFNCWLLDDWPFTTDDRWVMFCLLCAWWWWLMNGDWWLMCYLFWCFMYDWFSWLIYDDYLIGGWWWSAVDEWWFIACSLFMVIVVWWFRNDCYWLMICDWWLVIDGWWLMICFCFVMILRLAYGLVTDLLAVLDCGLTIDSRQMMIYYSLAHDWWVFCVDYCMAIDWLTGWCPIIDVYVVYVFLSDGWRLRIVRLMRGSWCWLVVAWRMMIGDRFIWGAMCDCWFLIDVWWMVHDDWWFVLTTDDLLLMSCMMVDYFGQYIIGDCLLMIEVPKFDVWCVTGLIGIWWRGWWWLVGQCFFVISCLWFMRGGRLVWWLTVNDWVIIGYWWSIAYSCLMSYGCLIINDCGFSSSLTDNLWLMFYGRRLVTIEWWALFDWFYGDGDWWV